MDACPDLVGRVADQVGQAEHVRRLRPCPTGAALSSRSIPIHFFLVYMYSEGGGPRLHPIYAILVFVFVSIR